MFYPEADLGAKVIEYPVAGITARFGTYFMTSSFAWMMALAIDEGVDEIGLWGVDMEYGTEFRQQRAGLRHFIDLAAFAGVTVTRLASSGIAYDPVPYPLWQDDPVLSKAAYREARLKDEMAKREAALEAGRLSLAQIGGALGEARSAKDGALDWDKRTRALARREARMQASLPQLEKDVAWCKGALDELAWLQDYLRP